MLSPLVASGATVYLAAGSVDALEDAIATAGPHGTVVLEGGLHSESATVTIDIPVRIVGEDDAILEVHTIPDDDPPFEINAALHIYRTAGVVVDGLTLRPTAVPAGDGILIQDSPHVTLKNNAISGFNVGVWVQRGNHARITRNVLESMRFGAIIVNGTQVSITSTVVGILLCQLLGPFVWPDGVEEDAALPATRWLVANNDSHNNVVGYVLTDGANMNLLSNNAASDNTDFDILLEGEFDEPPDYFPPASQNLIVLGRYKDLSVLDDGVDNVVIGQGN
jgi:nitrous oxidase accessory protein NosD